MGGTGGEGPCTTGLHRCGGSEVEMLCPRVGRRRVGGRDETSENSEGGGSDAEHHCYPARQRGRDWGGGIG
eukprot:scaffold46940_cov63-Phaeocystis_antarctica.AAC.1